MKALKLKNIAVKLQETEIEEVMRPKEAEENASTVSSSITFGKNAANGDGSSPKRGRYNDADDDTISNSIMSGDDEIGSAMGYDSAEIGASGSVQDWHIGGHASF